jgi:hypothetical protein
MVRLSRSCRKCRRNRSGCSPGLAKARSSFCRPAMRSAKLWSKRLRPSLAAPRRQAKLPHRSRSPGNSYCTLLRSGIARRHWVWIPVGCVWLCAILELGFLASVLAASLPWTQPFVSVEHGDLYTIALAVQENRHVGTSLDTRLKR